MFNFNIGLVCIVLIGCASDSVYKGGAGSFNEYESLSSYNKDVKYSSNTKGITEIDSSTSNRYSKGKSSFTNKSSSDNKNSYKQEDGKTSYTPPVSGSGHFKPTKSILGGMRDSEAIQRATMKPYTVRGKTYRPHAVKVGDTFDGIASWYGPDFHARSTSNGETYNMYAHTAAHKTLPMNTIVSVFNKDNGKSTVVRINDRGPFVEGRIIDLSNVAAKDIQMVSKGIANVRIEVIGFGGDLKNNNSKVNTNRDSKTKAKNPKTSAIPVNSNLANQEQYEQPNMSKNQKGPIDIESYDNNELIDHEKSAEITKSINDNDNVSDKQNSPQNVQKQSNQALQTKLEASSLDVLVTKDSIGDINVIEDTLDEPIVYGILPNQNSRIVKTTNSMLDNKFANKNDSIKGNIAVNTSNNNTKILNEENVSLNNVRENMQNNRPDMQVIDLGTDNKPITDNDKNTNYEKTKDTNVDNFFNPVMSDIDNTIQKLKDSTNQLQTQMQNQEHQKNLTKQINLDEASVNKTDLDSASQNKQNQNTKYDVTANQEPAEVLTQDTKQELDEKDIQESPNVLNKDEPQDNKTNQQKESSQAKQPNKQESANNVTKVKNGSHMVSLNVFSQKDRAERFKEQMDEKFGSSPYNIDIIKTDNGLFRVALRGFKNSSEAKEFISQNKIAGHVVAE